GRVAVADAFLRLHRPPAGSGPRALRTRHRPAALLPEPVHRRRLLPRARAPVAQAGALPERRRPEGIPADVGRDRGPTAVPRRGFGCKRRFSAARRRRCRADLDPVRGDRAGEPDRRGELTMSRDIIEAVRTIEREKGIEEDTLIQALEDALLAA